MRRDRVHLVLALAELAVRVPIALPVDLQEETRATDADWTRRRRLLAATSGPDSLVLAVVLVPHLPRHHKLGASMGTGRLAGCSKLEMAAAP